MVMPLTIIHCVGSGNAGNLAEVRLSNGQVVLLIVVQVVHVVVLVEEVLHGMGRCHKGGVVNTGSHMMDVVMVVLNAFAVNTNFDHSLQTGARIII